MTKITTVSLGILGLLVFASPAMAGRGGSSQSIAQAINSGSVAAIESELERTEVLICGTCVKLVKPLVDHPDARVRRVAAWWLVRRNRTDLFVAMANRLGQPDSTLARNAADVLGEIKSYKAIAPLGAALNNPLFSEEARAAMARALGAIGDMQGLPSLTTALGAGEPGVRVAALEGIRSLRGFKDPTVAVAMLSDANADVRIEAIFALGTPRTLTLRSMAPGAGDTAVRTLAGLVTQDPDARVRKKAAWALGEIKASASLAGASLQQAAGGDESPLVRSLAKAALTNLSP